MKYVKVVSDPGVRELVHILNMSLLTYKREMRKKQWNPVIAT